MANIVMSSNNLTGSVNIAGDDPSPTSFYNTLECVGIGNDGRRPFREPKISWQRYSAVKTFLALKLKKE